MDSFKRKSNFVTNGHIMYPDAVDAQIKRGCEHIGIKTKTMHKIRKTYGSILLHNGVNISAVKDMLGHADETTTLKHYIITP
ncbi:MAG: tyrosine-type recombinase/integrase [Butyrivibrio sp.]|nr:tyrosine-type recombinase/integrase [Butyrivibrio sp.]